MSETRRKRHFARSSKREERKNYPLPPSRASHSFRASRKMSRSPRLAHKAPVMQVSMVAHFRNTYCRDSVHTYNGDFGAISVRKKSFTAPVLKSGSSNIGLFFCRLSSSQSDRDCSGSK